MAGRRHASEEITAKLAQANDLAAKGKTQREISKALGVSIMTYHRWKKMMNVVDDDVAPFGRGVAESQPDNENAAEPYDRLRQLELENARLRRLVTDMLLEKLKREDELRARQPAPFGRPGKGK
jgi:putative transposase